MSNHASSPTIASGEFRIPSLDGLRAIAVMIVFIGHCFGVPSIFPGHVGVTIFFFLSGYLITTLLRREYERFESISLSKFYLRRAFRILPAAYLAIMVSVLLGATGILSADTTIWGVIAETFHFTNYYVVIHGREGLPPETSMLWSLSVEEHYYLIFPLTVLLFFRSGMDREKAGKILLFTAFGVSLWRIVLAGLDGTFDRLYTSTDTRIDSLLYGSAMALLLNPMYGDRLEVWNRLQPRLGKLAAAAVLLFAASSLVPGNAFRLTIADVVQSAAMVPIFWYIITKPQSTAGAVLNHPWVVRLGVLSFSFYLFHRMVLAVIRRITDIDPVVNISAFLVTVALAQLIYVFVERPCLGYRKRLEAQLPAVLPRSVVQIPNKPTPGQEWMASSKSELP